MSGLFFHNISCLVFEALCLRQIFPCFIFARWASLHTRRILRKEWKFKDVLMFLAPRQLVTKSFLRHFARYTRKESHIIESLGRIFLLYIGRMYPLNQYFSPSFSSESMYSKSKIMTVRWGQSNIKVKFKLLYGSVVFEGMRFQKTSKGDVKIRSYEFYRFEKTQRMWYLAELRMDFRR